VTSLFRPTRAASGGKRLLRSVALSLALSLPFLAAPPLMAQTARESGSATAKGAKNPAPAAAKKNTKPAPPPKGASARTPAKTPPAAKKPASSASPRAASEQASPQKQAAQTEASLKALRQRIETLQSEIAAAEGSHAEAADQLKSSEQAISTLQREQLSLSRQNEDLHRRIETLNRQESDLGERLAAQRQHLGNLLHSQYLRGAPDSLRLFLGGDDPNQISRDLYYLSAIARMRTAMLKEIDATLKEKQNLAATTREQASRLEAVETKQKAQRDQLLAQRAEKEESLKRIATQIEAQRREVGSLQRDEKRLSNLIEELTRMIAAQEEARRQAEVARQKRMVEEKERIERERAEKATQQAAREKPREAEKPAAELENEYLPEAAPAGSFARLKGNLRLPARGTVSNRFGSARPEGGNWRGIFVRAAAGGEVRAIAAGRVVFADWMRGFGNLLIIDHGDAYLSIYGNNDTILKQLGDMVQGGDVVARIGNSGGNPESGLYFELRHKGRPLDPLQWVALK